MMVENNINQNYNHIGINNSSNIDGDCWKVNGNNNNNRNNSNNNNRRAFLL